MNPRHLIPQALTETSFAPYGRVLQVPADGHGGQSINDGTSQRFELVANALLTADAGHPVISISRALARVLPRDLLGMERTGWAARALCRWAQHGASWWWWPPPGCRPRRRPGSYRPALPTVLKQMWLCHFA